MDKPQTSQSLPPERKIFGLGDVDAFFIANDDILNKAGSGNKNSDLSADLSRNGHHQAGEIVGNNFRRENPASVKTLQARQVKMLKTG